MYAKNKVFIKINDQRYFANQVIIEYFGLEVKYNELKDQWEVFDLDGILIATKRNVHMALYQCYLTDLLPEGV